ncbi:hypothetical protein ASF53_20905 [Methylobacterium sp. Leaf123]|nr:hypothetical protein ASF53_20905 [Methylobacterium sp. Leaf123]
MAGPGRRIPALHRQRPQQAEILERAAEGGGAAGGLRILGSQPDPLLQQRRVTAVFMEQRCGFGRSRLGGRAADRLAGVVEADQRRGVAP